MKKICVNVRDGSKETNVHIKVKAECMKLLQLILSESESVVGFWEE